MAPTEEYQKWMSRLLDTVYLLHEKTDKMRKKYQYILVNGAISILDTETDTKQE